jgi:hypothetical protein
MTDAFTDPVLLAYRARDARISIGYPVLQDNQELEYPGFIDGILIGFYARPGLADLALHNILDTGLAALLPSASAPIDVDYAPVGF